MTGTEPRYVQICPGRPLPSIAQFAPFRAVIVLNTEYDRAWQDEVSDWLVASGCLYVMAWGPDCSNWDDSVDWANLTANASEIPDAKFIMTTWHDDDTLEDTFWYAEFNARFSYDDVELHEAVIVDVSQSNREQELVALFRQALTLAERKLENEPPPRKSWLARLLRL